jgi:hypothetical protein
VYDPVPTPPSFVQVSTPATDTTKFNRGYFHCQTEGSPNFRQAVDVSSSLTSRSSSAEKVKRKFLKDSFESCFRSQAACAEVHHSGRCKGVLA